MYFCINLDSCLSCLLCFVYSVSYYRGSQFFEPGYWVCLCATPPRLNNIPCSNSFFIVSTPMCNRFSQILLNLCCSKGPLLKRIMHQGYFISNPFSVINLFDPGYEGNREKSQDSHFWTHNKLKSVRIRSPSGIHFWIDLLHICTCWNTKVMDISGIYRNPIKILPFGPIQTLTGKGELQVRKPSLVE